MLNDKIEKDRIKSQKEKKKLKQSSATFQNYTYTRNESLMDQLARDTKLEHYPTIIDKNQQFQECFQK